MKEERVRLMGNVRTLEEQLREHRDESNKGSNNPARQRAPKTSAKPGPRCRKGLSESFQHNMYTWQGEIPNTLWTKLT